MTDLHQEVAQLKAQVAELSAILAKRGSAGESETPGPGSEEPLQDSPTSRRQLLKLAGAAAVGAAGASLAVATPAGATTGLMEYGATNNAGADYTVLESTNSTITLHVANTGVGGAIFGLSESGDGVTGESHSGAALTARPPGTPSGVPLYLWPAASSGPPTAGAHYVGQFFVDSNGAVFTCVASGTPGTWVRMGFNPLPPTRILDSRNGTGGFFGPLHAKELLSLAVGGRNGVPAQASAVVLNATVTDSTSASYLTIWPTGLDRPTASNLNWSAGETIPNNVTVKLGESAAISMYSPNGDVQVILDLAGFYS